MLKYNREKCVYCDKECMGKGIMPEGNDLYYLETHLDLYLRKRKYFKKRGNKLIESPFRFDKVVSLTPLSLGLNNAVYNAQIRFRRRISRKKYEHRTRSFILRIHPNNDARVKAENEAFHLRLLDKIPIPKAHLYYYESDPSYLGHRFFLLDKLEGEPLTDVISNFKQEETIDFLTDLAQLLGRLHSFRNKHYDSYYLPKKKIKEISFASYILHDVNLSLKAFRKMNLDKEFQVDVEYLYKWAKGHKPLLSLKEFSLIHGDLRPSNIIVNNGKISGLIDWEMCCFSDPAQDIGWTLFFFKLYENLKNTRSHFFKVYWDHARSFDVEARVPFYEFLAALKIFTYTMSNKMFNKEKYEKNKDFFERVISIFPTYLDRVLYRD